jgi:pimeloyl-ACP methyl ester carboxylesterase
VAPTLRGYEPSSQPRRGAGGYHVSELAADVTAWMTALGAPRAALVGHDWGAAVGYATAALAPERVTALATLAVPHLRHLGAALRAVPSQARNSWYMAFFQLPGVAGRALAADDLALLERLWRDWSPGWQDAPVERLRLKATFRAPGVVKAALAYYRALPDLVSSEGRASWRLLRARVPVPTLALTGARDGCMDTRLVDVAMRAGDFPRGLRVERVAGAGHFLHLERPAEVNGAILGWLSAHAPAAQDLSPTPSAAPAGAGRSPVARSDGR